jgi:hypothetical protein
MGEPVPDTIDLDDGRQDLEGIGAFLMLGAADRDNPPASGSVSPGLAGKGLLRGRDRDTAGMGYFYDRLQDPKDHPGGPAGSERAEPRCPLRHPRGAVR